MTRIRVSDFKIELAIVLAQWIPLLRHWLYNTLYLARVVTAASKTNMFVIAESECCRVFISLLLLVSLL